MRTVPSPLLGMCEGACSLDQDCQDGMKCMPVDDEDEQLVDRWCTGVRKFNYCFPEELVDADAGCAGHNSQYTCGIGGLQACAWVSGQCVYSGTLSRDPQTGGSCGGCTAGSTGAGTPKQLACAALSNECALVLDTAQRMNMKALARSPTGELMHTEAAVMGPGNLLFSDTHRLLPAPSSTAPFSTRTKNARRYFAKVLSLCGSNDPDRPGFSDRNPGPAPLPAGWTKLCDGEADFTEPCDEDDVSYRDQRTGDQTDVKPTVPSGTCSLETIGDRMRAVTKACKHEYFPHPTIRRYGNQTDCLDYRHLARALRDDEFIQSCSASCASVFVPFVVDCNVVLNALADHGEEFLGPGKSFFPKVVNVLSWAGELCQEPVPRNCSAAVFDGNFNVTLFNGERQESIPEYAGRLLRIAVAVIVKGMKRGEVMVAYVMAAAAFLAWGFNIVAMSCWYNMKNSVKWIRIGWACAFLAPFLISTYPMKTFIDLQEANGVVLAFRDTLNQHFLEESIRASEYADARANASHIYGIRKLEQARIDLENQQIATQRDFERFGAEMEEYSEETHQAMMDSMESQKAAISQHLAAANEAYAMASDDAAVEADEKRDQAAGISAMIQDKLNNIHQGLYKTCEILDDATVIANYANAVDNIVPWFIIKGVEDFINMIPQSFGFSVPKVCLGPFCIPSWSVKIPLPWAWPVTKIKMVFWLVPSEEIIPDSLTEETRAFKSPHPCATAIYSSPYPRVV